MKHFKLIGPETTREFDIEDDEMLSQFVIKISDYESGMSMDLCNRSKEQSIKVYPTEKT